MNDDHRRLSPYVRDEEALQRGIEQTALAQTRAAMTTSDANVIEFDKYQPSTTQVLETLAKFAEAAQRHYAAYDADQYSSKLEHDYGCKRDEIEELDVPHLRQLAQTHTDQQARLRGLVEGWRAEACLEAIDSWERGYNAGVNGCAEELEAVLGRENE